MGAGVKHVESRVGKLETLSEQVVHKELLTLQRELSILRDKVNHEMSNIIQEKSGFCRELERTQQLLRHGTFNNSLIEENLRSSPDQSIISSPQGSKVHNQISPKVKLDLQAAIMKSQQPRYSKVEGKLGASGNIRFSSNLKGSPKTNRPTEMTANLLDNWQTSLQLPEVSQPMAASQRTQILKIVQGSLKDMNSR